MVCKSATTNFGGQTQNIVVLPQFSHRVLENLLPFSRNRLRHRGGETVHITNQNVRDPVPSNDDPDNIGRLVVAADLPASQKRSDASAVTESDVVAPVKRPNTNRQNL